MYNFLIYRNVNQNGSGDWEHYSTFSRTIAQAQAQLATLRASDVWAYQAQYTAADASETIVVN